MQLDRIAIGLRTREPWEAIDLGAAMVRAWWRPVYGAWFAFVLPIALGLAVLAVSHPVLALAVLWWLKPLYDRIVLHVLSQAVFGAPPRTAQTLSHVPTLLRASGLAGALTLRRFDPVRSFNLPVRQLELQQGKTARARERLLGRRAAGQASGLLYACLAFELILVLSLGLFADQLAPAGIPSTPSWDGFFRDLVGLDDTPGDALLRIAFAFAAITVVEPLYIASGFALYLNRRSALEAWDLELAFRRMDRPAPRKAGSLAALLVIGLLSGMWAYTPAPAWANPEPAESRKIIREVLASPDFAEYRTTKAWRPKETQDADTERSWMSGWLSSLADLLKSLAEALSQLSRVAGYVAVVVLLYFVVRFLLKSARGRQSGDSSADASRRPPPQTLFGLDVRPDSLPANLAELAAEAARRDPRLALSLLYRGALATLMHRDRLAIEAGDTEGDCLRRVRRMHRDDLSGYFTRLVAAWSQTAYGAEPADAASVQALCADWPQFFAAQAGAHA